MATVSIRDAAQHCLGRTGTIRVYRHLFGYVHGRIGRDLRVRQHIERIRGRSINLCMIMVGFDGLNGIWAQHLLRVQHAIDLTREIYAKAGLGVRKIFWMSIRPPESDPYLSVDAGEATDLTEAYSSPRDGIDVFWVETITDAGGWSNSQGPCDKDAKIGRTGAVIELTTSSDNRAGVLLAHEVGHYLTLGHDNSLENFMGIDPDGDGIGSTNTTARGVLASQAEQMLRSCWVRPVC